MMMPTAQTILMGSAGHKNGSSLIAEMRPYHESQPDIHQASQQLCQDMLELEVQIAQLKQQEQDLEMVLGNVWQALVRSGSADARPASSLWKLVRRFASSVVAVPVPPDMAMSQTMVTPFGMDSDRDAERDQHQSMGISLEAPGSVFKIICALRISLHIVVFDISQDHGRANADMSR